MNNSNPAQQPTGGNTSKVDVHMGSVLLKLSNTYDSLLKTVIEGVQNAIDGQAQHVFVGINLRDRLVNIADDGLGVDKFSFEQALRSVGRSVKQKDKLGRFGLGLISPLNKCDSFTFISSAMVESGRFSNKWTFRAKDIAQQEDVSIPVERIRNLPVVGKAFRPYLQGEFDRAYRTLVSMNRITQDKVISLMDLDELESEMVSKLGVEMRRKAIKVKVVLIDSNGKVAQREIIASDFSGEKLKVMTFKDRDAGEVVFTLYRAQRRAGKRQGLVSVMEANNPSSISINDFARQTRTSRLKSEVESAMEALTSGYFEGTISATGITMHPERTKFENNEPLRGLIFTLCLWYEEQGKAEFKNELLVTRETRYQDLGLKSQKRLQEFLGTPYGERLMATLRSTITFGRLGDGHVPPQHGRPTGPEPITSVRVGQGGAGKAKTTPPVPSPPRPKSATPGPDRPGDTPFGVTGPRGATRRLVRGDSQGLWYEHSALPGNTHLWEFDQELGVLTFNVMHPLWSRLDETNGKHTARNAKQIMHLQEWLTLEVLNLLAAYTDAERFDEHRYIIDDKLRLYVEMFIMANR